MQRTMGSLAALLLVGTMGCQPAADAPVPADAKPAAPPVAREAAIDPCALLPEGALARVVPGIGPGERDRAEEGYGTLTCRWGAGEGAVILQVFGAGPGALAHELRAASLEIVDLKRPDAGTLVRMERFPGIADAAAGFVERADPARGIRRPYAMLMVQRGDRIAALRMPALADRERAAALEAMQGLARGIGQGL